MNRLGIFIIGFCLGCAFMFGGLHYQIVHANDKTHVVPKLTSHFLPLYIDVRKYTPNDWRENVVLTAEVTSANLTHIMVDSSLQPFRDATQPFREAAQPFRDAVNQSRDGYRQ